MGEYNDYVKKHYLKPYSKYLEEQVISIQKIPEDENDMADYSCVSGFIECQQYLISQIYNDVINIVLSDGEFDGLKFDLKDFVLHKIKDISEGFNGVTVTFHFQTAWDKHYIGYWWYSHEYATGNEPDYDDGECGVLEEVDRDGKLISKD